MKNTLILLMAALVFQMRCSNPFPVGVRFGVVVVSPQNGLSTSESATAPKANFSVSLATAPTAPVKIGVRSSDVSRGTVNRSFVQFTADNWNIPQIITVSGVDDGNNPDGDHTYQVVLDTAQSTDPNYDGVNPPQVSLVNKDNDAAGISVTPTSGLVTTEAGGNASFQIVLNKQPTATVTLTLSSTLESEGRLKRSAGVCNNAGAAGTGTCTVTFTTLNWNTPQSIGVIGQDDALADGNVSYFVVFNQITTTDPEYSSVVLPNISLSNIDDDVLGFTVSGISGPTTESGGTATFTIKLNTAPGANVSVSLSSSNSSEGVISSANPVIFTPVSFGNQTVTITGVADNKVDGNISYSIITAAAVSADPNYNGLDPADVSVVNNDVDINPKFIFLTSQKIKTFMGAPYALIDADFYCDTDSAKPPVGGPYRAVIGVRDDSGFVIRDRTINWVLSANQKYYRYADKILVGTTNASAYFGFNLTNSFHTSAVAYWTGLTSTFTSSGTDCSDGFGSWNTGVGSGTRGDGGSVTGTAVSNGGVSCASTLSLLCAE